MAKTETINIALTDEMKRFVTSQSGDGTMYATPSEYVRDLIRHECDKKEAAALRESILEGYHDVLAGRYTKFSGDLLQDIKDHKALKANDKD